MELRMRRVRLYNALVKKHMGEMFRDGVPRVGSREEVEEIQARVLEDKRMVELYRGEEQGEDGSQSVAQDH